MNGEKRANAGQCRVLIAIKTAHTVVWVFIAGSIVSLPVVGWYGHFRWAAALSVLVVIECGVLAVNGGRCPLTDLAAKYTADRRPDFDIYLPEWLAKHNKTVFGALFVVNELAVLWERFQTR